MMSGPAQNPRKGVLCIAGATGFIGRHLLRRAFQEGWRCSLLVRDPGRLCLEDWKLRVVCGAISDQAALGSWLEGGAALLYLVPLVQGHLADICEATREAGICRAIFVSNSIVKCQHLEPNVRATILEMEGVIRQSQLAWTIVRPTMVFGYLQDHNVSELVRWIQRHRIVPLVGRGKGLVQPLHVDDLITILLRLVERPGLIGRVYEVGGGSILANRELAEEIVRLYGLRRLLFPIPTAMLIGASWVGRKILGCQWPSYYQLRRACEDKSVDNRAALHDLGFSPRSFSAALASERSRMTACVST